MNSPPRIVVLGSINMDLVVRAARLPLPGETLTANSLAEIPGGKGANQAVAAARAGGRVQMIGSVGDDAFASRLRANLEHESIDCAHVSVAEASESGVAIVAVEDSGENSILVVPGANGRVSVDHVRDAAPVIAAADVLMVQLEVPLETVAEGVRIAKENSTRVIFDPAPARSDLPPPLFEVDLICPNESEAAMLTGLPCDDLASAEAAARRLQSFGCESVAITLGAQGTLLLSGDRSIPVPSISIEAADTTAAGDGFAGALAVRWAETGSLETAVRFANVAGALAASRHGAQPSLARREEIGKGLQ